MSAPTPRPPPPWRRLTQHPITPLLLLALVVREAFAFWTGHPYDFEIWIRTGHAVGQPVSVDPYVESAAVGRSIPGLSFAYLNGQILPSAAYPPFWPLILGGLYRAWAVLGGGDRFALYFLFKQPAILADLAICGLLYRSALRWTGSARTAFDIAAYWAIFPYDIIIGAIWGQFDAIVVAILLAGLLATDARVRNALWGLGIFIKWLTVIFLPLEVFRGRRWSRGWPFAAAGLAIGLTVGAFLATGWGTVAVLRSGGFPATSVAQSEGGLGGMNLERLITNGPFAAALIGGAPGLLSALGWLWVPAVVAAGAFAARRWRSGEPADQLAALTFVLSIFFLFRFGLNEQYMLYLFPLLLLDVYCFHPQRRPLYTALVALSLSFLVLNNALGIWFTSPADPSLWTAALAFNAGAVPFPSWTGPLRAWLLNVLALLITLLLVQIVHHLARGREDWHPWFLPAPPHVPTPAAPAPGAA